MDLTQLKTLALVAELGSLRKASERLNLAQPALSRHIRLLEETLDVELFERHGRGMMITDAGRDVLNHANRIINEFEAIRHSLDQRKTSLSGSVVIGVPPTVAKTITAPLIKRICETHPRLTIRFSSAFSGHMLDWLKRGEIDMALVYDPQLPASASIATRALVHEAMYLVGGSKRGLLLNRPVSFNSLAHEDIILPSQPHGMRQIVNRYADEAGITIAPCIEADSLGAMLDLIQNDFGTTILPLTPIYSRVLDNQMSAAPITDPSPIRTLVLAHSGERQLSPAVQAILELFVEVTRELIERQVWVAQLATP